MTTFILEILVIMAAAVAAFFVLRPYVPIWFWFTIYVLVALYSFAHMVVEGPERLNVGGLVFFGAAALHAWWHDLRRDRRQQQGP